MREMLQSGVEHLPAARNAFRSSGAGARLTPRQTEVYQLLGAGLLTSDIAERLTVSTRAVNEHCAVLRERLNLATIGQLRSHSRLAYVHGYDSSSTAVPRPTRTLLRRQSRFLPHAALNFSGRLSSGCRAAPCNLRFLRDVADYMLGFDAAPGGRPDCPDDVLAQQGGTLGAKQALLAALAHECARDEVQLTIACGELTVTSAPGLETLFLEHPTRTLPLAICYLRCRNRRLQICDFGNGSQMTAPPDSESTVDPADLAKRRLSLYREFAADWCRAFDLAPPEFARLRAHALRTAPTPAVFEDLMGHALGPNFQPTLAELRTDPAAL